MPMESTKRHAILGTGPHPALGIASKKNGH